MQQIDSNQALPASNETVKVWDRFIRVFHWSLVVSVVMAFATGELHVLAIHALAGYAVCVLLAARIYWGFKGAQYARFRSFVFPVGETLAYVRSMLKGQPRHYVGHNPAGALMVFGLLVLLVAIFATGILTLGVIEFEGPLVFLANRVSDEASYAFRHIHEFLPLVGLVAVALHLLGVLAGSLLHRENLVRAMITGKKQLPASAIPEKI